MTRARHKRVALLVGVWLVLHVPPVPAADADHWIGTWATAAQPARPASAVAFRNQSVRLIVHTSAGGKKLRVRLSNA